MGMSGDVADRRFAIVAEPPLKFAAYHCSPAETRLFVALVKNIAVAAEAGG